MWISGGTYIFDVAKAIIADIAVGYISDTFQSAKFKTQHEHKDKRKPASKNVHEIFFNLTIGLNWLKFFKSIMITNRMEIFQWNNYLRNICE